MSDPMSTPTGPTRPPPLDLAACEELMRGGSKSFFAASSLLPQHVRMPSIALYAFCRVADDAIDENTDDPLAMDKLRARLDAIYAGEPGEIILKNKGVFKGYWNKPEATAKALKDGWVYTGDMGKMDAEGYLTFMGRFKEMIKVSGYSVFPEEVETILIKHPAIAQAAVIGMADAEKGEVVQAFIVLKPGQSLDARELVQWARDNMAAYKVPRDVRFIDALPATGSGKVLRRLLKDAD